MMSSRSVRAASCLFSLAVLLAGCAGDTPPRAPLEAAGLDTDAGVARDAEDRADTPGPAEDPLEGADTSNESCSEDLDCGGYGACRQGQCSTRLRVATWNIQRVGAPNSEEFQAALAILRRIGAHVVALQEVAGAQDAINLQALSAQAGYPHVAVTKEGVFGSGRNAFMSALPFARTLEHTSSSLSGEDSQDITRAFIEVVIETPSAERDLTIVSFHAKSGRSNLDEFRRVCESFRVSQVLGDLEAQRDSYVLLGDFNEEIEAGVQFPEVFEVPPDGLPSLFDLGTDLLDRLERGGLTNDPFFLLQELGGPELSSVEARQVDGSRGTRPESGRQLDDILIDGVLVAMSPSSEVYNSVLDSDASGLDKLPPALSPETSAEASDHLPVFADLFFERTP